MDAHPAGQSCHGPGITSMVAARDLSPVGIRVVTIAPGTFLTPAYGKSGDQVEA